MPDTWMTIAEAATALKVHPRTIERRIASGRVQTRRTDAGLLQVFIDLPAPPDSASDTALTAVRDLAADQLSLATGTASALVKFAQDDSTRARHELRSARRLALGGWLLVAAMGVGVCVAVGWTASKITRANADVRQLSDHVRQAESRNQELETEIRAVRQALGRSEIESAVAAARLSTHLELLRAKATSQPAPAEPVLVETADLDD
jgi:outer membrane murein-binding lipoprotein Lpp